MHLIERYSLSAGAKISKPKINQKFFPIPFEKYITINTKSGMVAKSYDFWGDVINIILPKLKELDIAIVQLGDGGEPPLPDAYYLGGQTNMGQAAYIVQNSLLHLGVDSFLVHVAAGTNTPVLSLNGIAPPHTCGPYFGDKSKQIVLEPRFKDNETYHYTPDGRRSCNTIKPEEVVNALGKLLGIDFPKIETLYIGSNYLSSVIEILPDSGLLSPEHFPGATPTIRLDLGGEEKHVYTQLAIRKCAIYCNFPLNVNILAQLKPNIERVVYQIGRTPDISFIKELQKFGIPWIVLTEENEEEMGLTKLDLADFCIVHQKPKGQRPDIEMTEDIRAKTNRIFLAAGNVYPSIEHWRMNEPQKTDTSFKIIDTPSFWVDSADFVMLYRNS